MTDPISDMLTRIRNAQAMKHESVLIPFSKVKFELSNVLLKEGYVSSVEVNEKELPKMIALKLKYSVDGDSVIRSIKRVSKPGLRVYKNSSSLPYVLDGMGIAIISTSQGMMTNNIARKKKLGGEVICEIW